MNGGEFGVGGDYDCLSGFNGHIWIKFLTKWSSGCLKGVGNLGFDSFNGGLLDCSVWTGGNGALNLGP